MKKILTLILLFTLVGFLSANQVIITNDYQYIITTEATYNFTDGNASSNIKYDRTNKIQIQNNKVIANPLKYHYAFFWQEDNTFIGYYKTNKGINTSGAYLGQVNTQSIPLPLNAYSFALVRYDNDYVLVNDFTIKELFIDNNLDYTTTHNINHLYYKRNGNIVSLNNYYYAAGKNLFFGEIVSGSYQTFPPFNFIFAANQTGSLDYIPVKSSTSYRLSTSTNTTFCFSRLIQYNSSLVVLTNINTCDAVISFTTDSTTAFVRYSIPTITTNIQLEEGTSATSFEAYTPPTNLYNLTLLFGAGNEPNLATMNGYYAAYEEYLDYTHILPLAFNTQTISFETIYFDDGVSTEIERLGSILIFTLIGFTLMIFGFASKRRIFNLLAVGAFVVLGFLLIEFVGFIIILFGLIFVNVYYTFFGEL